MKLIAYVVAFMLVAGPGNADPITAAIVSSLGVGAASFTAAVVGFVVNTMASILLSALATALAGKPKEAGIQTEYTKDGGTNSASFILGKYATAGVLVCPPMSHDVGKKKRYNATYVVSVGDIAGMQLNRLIVNGEYVALAATAETVYGKDFLGKYEDGTSSAGRIIYYNGTQTVVDPMLMTYYGSQSPRPWKSTMVGRGQCYAILTFSYDRKIYPGPPSVRFEMLGIPLYDPRKDTTVGGSGAHRWGDKATYEYTANTMVLIYNILRGIELHTGIVWGLGCAASDLPLDNWFAQMNKCDVLVSLLGGGTEKQYQAGYEIQVSEDEPADVIEELLKSCSGNITELGGIYKVRAGAPDLPVFFFTDGDLLITQPQEYSPFPGLNDAHNGIHASYPDPDQLWEQHDAVPYYDAALKTRDQERSLVADLSLSAVPYPFQVQRLMRAWVKDDQRWRRHTLPFGPYGSMLEPLDTVSWTSTRNGYVSKLFEIGQTNVDPITLNNTVAARECDPADYDWSSAYQMPITAPNGGWSVPAPQELPDWAVVGESITDNTGGARRPALRISWDSGISVNAAQFIRYEIRLTTTGMVIQRGVVMNVDTGSVLVSEGLLPNTAYQVRGILVSDSGSTWSAWLSATTPNTGLVNADFGSVGGYGALLTSQGLYAIRDVTSLPGSGAFVGEKVFNRTDGKLYQWTGSAWTLVVANPADGTITTAKFAAGLAPVELLAALPSTGNFAGRMVFLTTDNKLYRHTGSPTNAAGFTLAVDGADITANSIVAGKIAAGAISATELAAGSIIASKVAISDTANLYPDFDMRDTGFYSTSTAAGYYFFGTATAPLGLNCLAINASAALETVETNWFVIEPSAEYLVTAAAFMGTAGAGAGTVTVSFQTGSLSAAGVVTFLASTTVKSVTDVTYNAVSSWGTASVIAGATARRGRFVVTRSAGGTQAGCVSGLKVQKKANGELIVDGVISARHVLTGSMSADDIKTGTMDAANLTVTQLLKISTGTGALSVGKNSAFDFTNDGIFFGRTVEAGGGGGFGLLAGKKIGGIDQYLQATAQAGLKLVNANHYVSGLANPAAVNVATSQTVTLPVGTKRLDLEYLGGGGGGAGATNNGSEVVIVASNGGNTVIQLWDGAVNTGVSWTATGGLGATLIHSGDNGYAGANSALGTGGAGGVYPGAAGAGAGYGAGGGGGGGTEKGGNGGVASALISIDNYNVSALTAPKLVITIGAGGAGSAGQGGAGAGAAGSPGIVKYTAKTLTELPASILPMQPTYTGTIAKAASAVMTFPNYGAGLWVLNTQGPSIDMDIATVSTHLDGSTIRVFGTFASFVSDKTPVDTTTSAGAYTVEYQFYKLGNWV